MPSRGRRAPRSCRARSTGRCPSRAGRVRCAGRRAGTCRRGCSMSPGATPGPPSSMTMRMRSRSAAAIADPDRGPGGRVVGDVLEDVRDDRVEQDLVDSDERRRAGDDVRHRSVAEDRCEAADGPLDERLDLEDLEVGPERARLDRGSGRGPSARTGRAAVPRRRSLSPASRTCGRRHRDVRVGEVAGRRPDARQRRPQVVRHRIEQGALEGVAAPGDLGARRLLAQAVAAEAEGDLVGGQGQEPGRLRPECRPTGGRIAQSDPRTVPPVSILMRRTSPSAGGRSDAGVRVLRARGHGPSGPGRRRASGPGS